MYVNHRFRPDSSGGGKSRLLLPEELEQLLEAVPARRELYQLVAYSGLRQKECKALRTSDFILGPAPIWTFQLKYCQWPILPQAVEVLRRLSAGKRIGDRVFATVPTSAIFTADLVRAGLKSLDSSGARLNFISLKMHFAWYCCTQMTMLDCVPALRQADITVADRLNRRMDLAAYSKFADLSGVRFLHP